MSLTDIFTLSPHWQYMLMRFVVLFVVPMAFVWLYATLKLQLSKDSSDPIKVRTRQALIEGSLLGIFILSMLTLTLVYVTGWRRFVWDSWTWSLSTNTYLMMLPEIVMFVVLSVFFFIQRNKLLNVLKSK